MYSLLGFLLFVLILLFFPLRLDVEHRFTHRIRNVLPLIYTPILFDKCYTLIPLDEYFLLIYR